LVLKEWPKSPRPDKAPLENRITNRLVGHLQAVMRKTPSPSFKFLCRPKLPAADSDSETGEVDIQIDSFSCHPDAYFVFECKRLNVQRGSRLETGASAYVGKEGMGCFISGQYPTTCDCGGMIGYVMNQNVSSAIAAINNALSRHRWRLRLRHPHSLQQTTIVASDSFHQTLHDKAPHTLTIYHLLLPF
jgi:hypothetical protein